MRRLWPVVAWILWVNGSVAAWDVARLPAPRMQGTGATASDLKRLGRGEAMSAGSGSRRDLFGSGRRKSIVLADPLPEDVRTVVTLPPSEDLSEAEEAPLRAFLDRGCRWIVFLDTVEEGSPAAWPRLFGRTDHGFEVGSTISGAEGWGLGGRRLAVYGARSLSAVPGVPQVVPLAEASGGEAIVIASEGFAPGAAAAWQVIAFGDASFLLPHPRVDASENLRFVENTCRRLVRSEPSGMICGGRLLPVDKLSDPRMSPDDRRLLGAFLVFLAGLGAFVWISDRRVRAAMRNRRIQAGSRLCMPRERHHATGLTARRIPTWSRMLPGRAPP